MPTNPTAISPEPVATGAREIGPIAILLGVAVLTLGFGLLAEEVMEGDTKAFDAHVAGLFRVAGASSPVGPPWL